MKKLIALMLVIALAFTSILAQGESEDNEKFQVLRFAVWDAQSNAFVNRIKAGFEADHPGVTIDLVDSPSTEYMKKLNVMLNGGSDIDVFLSKEPDKTRTFYERGQLENLVPYIEREGIDMATYGGTDSNFRYDGGIYGIPFKKDQYVLFYNKDIFDAAGIEYPSNDMTWKEFEELAAKLTSGTGATKKYGAFIHSWQSCVLNWGIQNGEHTIMSGDYDIYKPAYEMVLRMQEAGDIMDYGTIKSSGIHYSDPFLQGNIAMLPMGSWFIHRIVKGVNEGESNVNWGIATIPHGEDTVAGYTCGTPTPVCMNKASDKKELAWEFIKWFTTDPGQTILAECGQIPSLADSKYLDIVTSIPGVPEGASEALKAVNVAPERPAQAHVTEVDQMHGQVHSLIMLGEVSVDEGLKMMDERFDEIINK